MKNERIAQLNCNFVFSFFFLYKTRFVNNFSCGEVSLLSNNNGSTIIKGLLAADCIDLEVPGCSRRTWIVSWGALVSAPVVNSVKNPSAGF